MKLVSCRHPAATFGRLFSLVFAFGVGVLATLVTAVPTSGATPGDSDPPITGQANCVVEVTFTAANPENIEGAVEVDAVFTAPGGDVLRVPAFWAGGRTWKARYASPHQGRHTFVTECTNRSDTGLHGRKGAVAIGPYTGDNPLYKHGPVRVSDNRRHFQHADGTPFFWLGDTWWMGLSSRLAWPEGFRALAADRRDKGFTVVQIVAGLNPDMVPLDDRGAGDGGQAWTEDFGRIRPEFYNEADRRIEHLVDSRLVPCIVAAWHGYLYVMGPEKMQRHWRNLVARYGAYPVVWVLGGEINANGNGFATKGGLKQVMADDRQTKRAAWTQVARYLKSIDPYGRVLGAHNVWGYEVLDDPNLLDMYFLQSGHSGLASIAAQTDWFDDLSRAEHRAPLVMSEGNYQGLWGDANFGDALQRHQFWATMLDGGAGHTYGGNGIWQANQPAKPFGPSPHGFSWGNAAWPQVMHYAASKHLGAGKRILESVDWKRLIPASQTTTFRLPELPALPADTNWVWPSEDKGGDLLLATTFDLPADTTVRRAILRLASQEPYTLVINGQIVHRFGDLDYRERHKHADAWLFPLAGQYLKSGRNTVMLQFRKVHRDTHRSGLLGHLLVEPTAGQSMDLPLSNWRWHRPSVGWPGDLISLDPSDWPTARTVSAPRPSAERLAWRQIEPYGPRCATVPGRLRLIYIPDAHDIELSSLPKRNLSATRIHPGTGEILQSENLTADAFGRATLEASSGPGDWLVIVREW